MEFPLTQAPEAIIEAIEHSDNVDVAKACSPSKFRVDIISPSKQAAKKRMRRENALANQEANKKEAYNPTVERGISVDIGKHFLGRGLVCVVLDNLGGQGPALDYTPISREVSQAQVTRLIDLASGDGSTLFREDPSHELVATISPEHIKVTSLSKSVSGPFQFVQFTSTAAEGICRLEDGKHRVEAAKQLFSASLKELKRLQDGLEVDPDNGKLRTMADAIKKKLRRSGYWLVAFYNRGKSQVDLGCFLTSDRGTSDAIDEDPNTRQAIYLKLATNSTHKGQPEKPLHHFRQIVHSLSKASTPEDRKAVFLFATTLQPEKKGDVRRLLTKY